jgi:hypothetical protein
MKRHPKRGLTDIRTLSGRVSKTHQTSRAYMQVTCLEMEKIRIHKELESALARADTIRIRLAQIEEEKQRLLQEINESEWVPPTSKNVPVGKIGAKGNAGFKLQY